ncbi:MAG: hypothetical protein ACI9HK_002198, partial [Pirellulaceae bacterium]
VSQFTAKRNDDEIPAKKPPTCTSVARDNEPGFFCSPVELIHC